MGVQSQSALLFKSNEIEFNDIVYLIKQHHAKWVDSSGNGCSVGRSKGKGKGTSDSKGCGDESDDGCSQASDSRSNSCSKGVGVAATPAVQT